jgi:serine/threonine protein kinase
MKDGLLLSEANCGDLQSYIDKHNAGIDNTLRKRWSVQAAEGLAHVHETGIIHSNVSTTNYLLHRTEQAAPDVLLGARCAELGLDGGLLPDDPFGDPHVADFESPKLDVFGLGVVINIIVTGHYPFHTGIAPQNEERFVYGDRVRALYEQGQFPSLTDVTFGDTIAGCCCERRFRTAREVVAALNATSDGGG